MEAQNVTPLERKAEHLGVRVSYIRTAFRNHKQRAEYQGIDFELTYDEWLTIWLKSGKLAERGKRRDEYVMARKGDKGPYAVGNVRIITALENRLERAPLSPETRKQISEKLSGENHPQFGRRGEACHNYGRKHSEETRRKVSEAGKGRPGTMRGKKHSDETRAKMRAAHARRLAGKQSNMELR